MTEALPYLMPLILLPTIAKAEPPPEVPSTVLFLHTSSGLLPLACFDAVHRQILESAACRTILPRKAAATDIGGRRISIGRSTRVACTGSGRSAAGYLAPRPRGVESFAVWSSTGLLRIVPLSGDRGAALPPQTAAALREDLAAATHLEHAPLQVQQMVLADLDGDQKSEKVVLAALIGGRNDYGTAVNRASGLFILASDSGVRPRLLAHWNDDRDTIVGRIDLDGDGKDELIVQREFGEGGRSVILRMKDGLLTEFGAWECGS